MGHFTSNGTIFSLITSCYNCVIFYRPLGTNTLKERCRHNKNNNIVNFFLKVVSEMKYESRDDISNAHMHYGLFDGKLTQSILQSSKLIDLNSNSA